MWFVAYQKWAASLLRGSSQVFRAPLKNQTGFPRDPIKKRQTGVSSVTGQPSTA